ncbi:CD209 antigen-like protein B [Ostrea edulis]|uniref:CD209 antigen-like protein B n=1 Tax=Ostrea edulis TaxID=37623 RepID=UPI0020959456|nr:CD209 antigen-like protein B [Ostrea edulis]
MSFAALFMLLIIAQTSQGLPWFNAHRRCPKEWSGFSGHCYFFSKEKATVKDAITKCAHAVEDGRLAEVGGHREEKWLELQIKIRGMSPVWMGASDISDEGKFIKLSNAKPIQYTNWNRGEPNDHQKKEDCVEWAGSGKWNDNYCGNKNFFICEQA